MVFLQHPCRRINARKRPPFLLLYTILYHFNANEKGMLGHSEVAFGQGIMARSYGQRKVIPSIPHLRMLMSPENVPRSVPFLGAGELWIEIDVEYSIQYPLQ